MITIKLNYYKLREAAFQYQQKRLKGIQQSQERLIDEYLSGFFLFKKPTRFEAAAWLDKNSRGEWNQLHWINKQVCDEYYKIRTACNLAEDARQDSLVEVDAETAYRIFGDVQ